MDDRTKKFTLQGICDEVLRSSHKSAVVFDDLTTHGGFLISTRSTEGFEEDEIIDINYLALGLDLEVVALSDTRPVKTIWLVPRDRPNIPKKIRHGAREWDHGTKKESPLYERRRREQSKRRRSDK